MADKPILFSAPMIRALLDRRKTQTRRILKPQPEFHVTSHQQMSDYVILRNEAHGLRQDVRIRIEPSDRLWVREAWRPSISAEDPWHVAVDYPADGRVKHWTWATDADFGDWCMPKQASKGVVPSIHMPRWASRLTLVVTDVRVQRLQDISKAEAIAEGIEVEGLSGGQGGNELWRNYENPPTSYTDGHADNGVFLQPKASFISLWNSTNGPDAWEQNPWVTATTFTVHKCNIDALEGQPND